MKNIDSNALLKQAEEENHSYAICLFCHQQIKIRELAVWIETKTQKGFAHLSCNWRLNKGEQNET